MQNSFKGGTLTVNGNVSLSGGSAIANNGITIIVGNVSGSGGSIICGTGTISVSGTVSPSSTVCDTQGILPVELIYFFGTTGSDNILLKWGIASEKSNASFEIERSLDGIYLKKIISTISKALEGNSLQKIDYGKLTASHLKEYVIID